MKFNFVETENFKHLRSPNSNYDFNKKTGYTEMWGKTKEEDIIYSDVGPQILDLEISTICNGYKDTGRCHFCSPPGTKINTPSGMKNIEDIQVDDVVLSARKHPMKSSYIVKNKVKELYKHDYSGDLIKIETDDGEILLTPDHIVILSDFSEKPAGELTLDDELISINDHKTCNHCGKIITEKSYHRYFCSKECFDKNTNKECLICGKPFESMHRRVFCFDCINTEGYEGHPLLNTYRTMLQRCYNKTRNKSEFYFERNIKVDSRWFNFETFLKDMGERPEGYTLDRIDNSLGYSKENCRWVEQSEQKVNRGRFKNSSRRYKNIIERESGKCYVSIRHNNKQYVLGTFDNIELAINAHNDKMKEFYPNNYERYINHYEN